MGPLSKADLRDAINEGEFVPHFQPKVDLRTGTIVGVEALARWEHPLHGLVSPGEFIPAIEELGLSQKFTTTMMHRIFGEAREFFPDSIFVAVNISPPQLLTGSLDTVIRRVSEEEAFPLHRLVVEITESALLDDLKRARACAKSLKSLGVRLAMDDFGVGYSSLHHLRTLPFDEVKIDMSFVRSMLRERESRKIVSGLVGLGNSLGLVTIAEGIEEVAQAAMLVAMGCDRGQGWLYGRPAPAHDVAGAIASQNSPPAKLDVAARDAIVICPILLSHPTHRFAQLQAIYDGAPVGLCFVDTRLRYVSINERLAAMHQRSVAEHLGRSIAEISPNIFPHIEAHLHRALRGEAIHELEVALPGASPAHPPRTMLATYQPARDEAGEIVGVSVAVMDITARKQTEMQLRDREACMKAILNAVPVGILVAKGPAAQIVAGNRKAEEILRSPLPKGSNADCCDETAGFGAVKQGPSSREDPLARIILDGQRAGAETLLCRRGDGSDAWLHINAAPIIGLDGKVTGGVATIWECESDCGEHGCSPIARG